MGLNEDNITYKCPNCGAAVTFDVKKQKLICSHCKTEFDDVEEFKQYQKELDVTTKQDEANWKDETKQFDKKELNSLKVYYCENCGGNLITDENTSSTICPYCGSPVIIKDRLAGELKPNFVIPFKHDKNDVLNMYSKYVHKKLFVKSDFFKSNKLEKFQGIYVPYWLFTSDTFGAATFKGYTVTTWMDADYIYTKKSYYSFYRDGGINFDHLPHDASKHIPDELTESVEPFYFKEAKDFSCEYLSGHAADKYDVTADEVKPHVVERMRNTLVEHFQNTIIGYSGVTCTGASINLLNPKVEYALYPIWLFNSTYKNKKYSFAMNGDTGKMTGNLPCSVLKFILWFLLWFVVTGGLAFLITWLCNNQKVDGITWGVACGVGLISPLIFCIYHAVKLKPVKKQKTANNYVVPDSFHLDNQTRHYLYSIVTKTRRSKNN